MRAVTTCAALMLVALIVGGSAADGPRALQLGTRGAAFTVNGEPRFLVLVSYFDAMDASALDADLAMLAKSVDGVRIFANWWDRADVEGCRNVFSPGTLFGPINGRLGVRPDRLARLKQVLGRARTHGLIVDLTFAADPVAGASKLSANEAGRVCPPAGFHNEVDWKAVALAIGETAAALSSPDFDHVFFDVQNEAGHDFNRAGLPEIKRLVDAVRAASPKRLVSVSMFDPDADRQAAIVKELGLSMLNFHDVPRGEGWGARTAGHVERFRQALARAGVNVPVYAGEPDADAYGRDVAEFRDAVAGARAAGAGAWTFHTRVAYDLRSASLDQRLDPLTRRVLASMRGWQGR